MDIKELNKKISEKSFDNIYFFHGDEDYLKDFYCDRLIAALVDPAFEPFNLFTYKDPITKSELIDAVEQPPMMSEYKVCYLNNINIGKCDQQFKDSLTDVLSDIPDFTILIIKDAALDKRSRLWTSIKKHAQLIECNYPLPADMRSFIGREFGKRGKKITTALADRIVEQHEKNMYSIVGLIDTVSAYLYDQDTVTESAVAQFIKKSLDAVVFDLSDALVNKDKRKAFDILNELKLTQTKNPPQILFSLLARHIIGLSICVINQSDRIPNSETAKLLGRNIPEFVVGKYLRQANGIKPEKLDELAIFCGETDYKLKTGQISDPYNGIYMLFAKFWQ